MTRTLPDGTKYETAGDGVFIVTNPLPLTDEQQREIAQVKKDGIKLALIYGFWVFISAALLACFIWSMVGCAALNCWKAGN